MLSKIKKNDWSLYFKRDVEGLGLPMHKQKEYPGDDFHSKSRLRREKKIILTTEQENNPHAFAQGTNGYYPIWEINLL